MIRLYEPADYAGLGKVCIQTGDSGQDATGQFRDDELLPLLFAYPYVAYAPDLAWVVDDGEVAGYIVGVADNNQFAHWWQDNWISHFDQTYQPVRGVELNSERRDAIDHERERAFAEAARNPGRMIDDEIPGYPARLHINLLPRMQGRGLGRQLVQHLTAELQNRSVPGLALGVSRQNPGAYEFYRKLGFSEAVEHSNASTRMMVIDL